MNKRRTLPVIILNAEQHCPPEIVIHGEENSVDHVVFIRAVSGAYTIRFVVNRTTIDSRLLVFLLLGDNQKVDLSIVQEYGASNSSSSLHLYGAIAGNAQINCRCQTIVAPLLRSVRANQKSTFLVLSESATASVVPAMQTTSHEHVVNHGAAVGSFDREHLFLLAAKGIADLEAKKMLLKGFFAQGATVIGHSDVPACINLALDHFIEAIADQ